MSVDLYYYTCQSSTQKPARQTVLTNLFVVFFSYVIDGDDIYGFIFYTLTLNESN